MSIPYIYNDQGENGTSSLTVCLENGISTVDGSNEDLEALIRMAEKGDVEGIRNEIDKKQRVIEYTQGKINIVGNDVYFGDEILHGSIVQRILSFMKNGYSYQSLENFLIKLFKNPSKRSVDTLYDYCERYKLPIDKDGNFLAMKAVNADFKDLFSGTVDNRPGTKVPRLPRNRVDDDPDRGCSKGYHVGNFNYVQSYGGQSARYVLVKVNPEDVICCPKDCSYQKMRVCYYEVLREIPNKDFREFASDSASDALPLDQEDCDYCYEDSGDYCSLCGDHYLDCKCTED